MPVLLFEEVKLLNAPIDVGARVVPGVRGVVLVRVGPSVCEVDFAGITDVGKGVENVCELRSGDVLRLVVPPVDCPVHIVSYRSVASRHGGGGEQGVCVCRIEMV